MGSVSSSWKRVPSSNSGTSSGGARGGAVDGGNGSGSAGASCSAPHTSLNLLLAGVVCQRVVVTWAAMP